MKRFQILKRISQLNGAKNYLEIGLHHGLTMRHLTHIPYRVGVDIRDLGGKKFASRFFMDTAEEFFKQNELKFDLVFIDAYHEYSHVLHEATESMKVLAPHFGAIVFHDMSPKTKEAEHWKVNGDCWKAMVDIRSRWCNVRAFTIDTDHGCGILLPDPWNNCPMMTVPVDPKDYTWENLNENRREWLGLVRPEEGMRMLVNHYNLVRSRA